MVTEKSFLCGFQKKAHKKKTSRPTGKTYYNTAEMRGQGLFSDFFRLFSGPAGAEKLLDRDSARK